MGLFRQYDLRVFFPSYLGAPQFDGPVERGGNKQVGEVQRPWSGVTVDPRDGPMVALEHLTNARFAAGRTD